MSICFPHAAFVGEKRSNHTAYTVNYHFVWCRRSKIDCLQLSDLQCPKYYHAILEPIENSLEASFWSVCDEYDHELLSLHVSPDHGHLLLSATRNILGARLYRLLKLSRHEGYENNTNRSLRGICGAVGSGSVVLQRNGRNSLNSVETSDRSVVFCAIDAPRRI